MVRSLYCMRRAKGAVPRETEVSVKSYFLPHLLRELKVVIFRIKKKIKACEVNQ